MLAKFFSEFPALKPADNILRPFRSDNRFNSLIFAITEVNFTIFIQAAWHDGTIGKNAELSYQSRTRSFSGPKW